MHVPDIQSSTVLIIIYILNIFHTVGSKVRLRPLG